MLKRCFKPLRGACRLDDNVKGPALRKLLRPRGSHLLPGCYGQLFLMSATQDHVSAAVMEHNCNQQAEFPVAENEDLVGRLHVYLLQHLKGRGHGLGHEDLRKLNRAALARAVVDDRAALRGAGFPCVSFAYPYGWLNDTVKQAVRDAGYASARVIHGLSDTTTLVPPARGGVAGGVLRVADRAATRPICHAHRGARHALDDGGRPPA